MIRTTPTIYEEGTFTPTVTLVGGAGNTVPVYSTNTGRYIRNGNQVSVEILLTGDGGAEGAGTGVINVALPFTANATSAQPFPDGLWKERCVRECSGGYDFRWSNHDCARLLQHGEHNGCTHGRAPERYRPNDSP